MDRQHILDQDLPAGTKVIPVVPSFWMKFLMILVLANTLVLATGITVVLTVLPKISDLEFNRKIFCEQEQVNNKVISLDCKKILNLP